MKIQMLENYNLYDYDEIELFPGITFLIGPNGHGKSTFLKNIYHSIKNKEEFKLNLEGKYTISSKNITDDSVLFYQYDAEVENNKTKALSNYSIDTNDLIQAMFFNSEGQNRVQSFYSICENIGKSVRFAIHKNLPLIVTIDAIDSGLDIAYCKMLRDFFTITLANDIKEYPIYIIIPVNQYTLIENTEALDVKTGNKISFSNYIDYYNFIYSRAEEEKNGHKQR